MLLYALRWKCQQGGENFLGWVSGVWRRSAGLLCLWGATTRRAKPRRISLFLMGERPPASPFLNDQKGAKESVKEEDFDFPLLDNPPLKTTKHRGELRLPPIGCTPQVFYCYAACTVGFLRNAAGARCAGAAVSRPLSVVPPSGWRRDLTLDKNPINGKIGPYGSEPPAKTYRMVVLNG